MTLKYSEENSFEIYKKIDESAWVRFTNELHSRSFSLNILKMNAVALIEATLHASDPDRGLMMMQDGNREEGQQAHRELSRHLHNFIASAMTLVEHTRVFMRKTYAGTNVLSEYEAAVINTFKDDPVSQFVQGLRNYLVHKGVPESQMFFNLEQSDGGGAKVETGIRIPTENISGWDKWNGPARSYLSSAGEFLDIRRFAEEYISRTDRFHNWLEDTLRNHHSGDLVEVSRLQKLYEARLAKEGSLQINSTAPPTSATASAAPLSARAARLADIREATNGGSLAAIDKIRQLSFSERKSEFPSQRHSTATITDKDIAGPFVFWGPDSGGIYSISFIERDGHVFGLSEADFHAVQSTIDRALEIPWVRETYSSKFIVEEFLNWARAKFLDPSTGDFAEALLKAGEEKVQSVEVWLPIAHLEIESAFNFGSVRIVPITEQLIDDLHKKAVAMNPVGAAHLTDFFDHIRKDLQGSAAVVLPMSIERNLAEEMALAIARDAVNLLRFFSPGSPLATVLCPTALLRSELIPGSTALFLTDQGLSGMTEKTTSPDDVARWRMPTRVLAGLERMGLSLAGKLLEAKGLTEFQTWVRASLITYSKGTTFIDPIDRLNHALAALEGVLLRHAMEPIEFNIADRMSFILSSDRQEREEITQNVRQAYRLRTRHRASPLAPMEMEALSGFILRAHTVLMNALANTQSFPARADFVGAVDSLGMQDATTP